MFVNPLTVHNFLFKKKNFISSLNVLAVHNISINPFYFGIIKYFLGRKIPCSSLLLSYSLYLFHLIHVNDTIIILIILLILLELQNVFI